jgi:CubicO group peptidase (beta-lactamase class C family)
LVSCQSYLSAFFGFILAGGAIDDINDLVPQYAPALIGTANDCATICDVLTMQSGMRSNENYLDFWSDINKMGHVLALGQLMDGFATAQTVRDTTPGAAWQYVSIDTHVIGMVTWGPRGAKGSN